jgi:hypothetical protein
VVLPYSGKHFDGITTYPYFFRRGPVSATGIEKEPRRCICLAFSYILGYVDGIVANRGEGGTTNRKEGT